MSCLGAVEASGVLFQNGDRLLSPTLLNEKSSLSTMESLTSISENPFFKHFGVKHNVPAASRRSYRSQTPEQQGNRQSLNGVSAFNDEEEDEIVEYRPGSGFVNKLLDKFSLLSTRDEQNAKLKRFSSLDHLQTENEITTDKFNKISTETDSPSDISFKLSANKAKSIDNLSSVYLRPHQYSRYGLPLQNSGKNDKYMSKKFQSNLDLSSHDIIIIENIPSDSGLKTDESSEKNDAIDPASNFENTFQDELPKPNTVLNVRSIFENASQTNLLLRRRTSDQPLSPTSPAFKAALSSLQTEQNTSGQDGASKRSSLRSASPTSPRYGNEPLIKPALLPNSGATFKRQFDSAKRPSDSQVHSRPEDVPSVISNSSISLEKNSSEFLPSTIDNSSPLPVSEVTSQSSNENKSGNFDGAKVFISTKPSGSQSSSSRSTASVKPTIINEQNAPVKPVPLSAPASSTIVYQRSRPVVSVAPYREKPEDDKNHGYQVNIRTDSQLSPRRDKPQQTIIANQLNTQENKDDRVKDNIILPREAKKIFQKDIITKTGTEFNNKTQSHEKRSLNVTNKNTTNQNITTMTTLEIRNVQTSVEDKEHQLLTEKSREKELDLNPVTLVAESKTKATGARRMAPEPPQLAPEQPQLAPETSKPEPPGNSQTKKSEPRSTAPRQQKISEDQNKNISLIKISNEDKDQSQAPRDITPPSKRSHSNDIETISEPPPKKTIEDTSESKEESVKGLESQDQLVKESESQDQPVKGIPSIIAQRLKHPTVNPSQAASGLVKIADSDSSFNNNPYLRTVLTPAGSNRISQENTEKTTVSSELENEISAVRRKMEANRSKSGAPAQIFDSSQLVKKKKKKQQGPSGGAVPSLDLSAITDEVMEYQPQMTKVKPCNIVFAGENTKTSRSLLDKKRKVKINIFFNDEKTETYEYPSLQVALEDYLEDHPNEREEVLVLEDAMAGESTDSSDDIETEVYLPATPIKDGLLASNTSLSHSGSFQSYRGRFQEEYQFGAVLVEQPQEIVVPEPVINPENQMLRPAEEDDTNTWSTSDSSDLLF